MAPTNSFEEHDRGYEEFKRAFRDLDGVTATVGVHRKDNDRPDDEGDITMASLLAVHEFGAAIDGTAFGDITIPPRPTLRAAIPDNESEYLALTESLLVKVVDGDISEVTMFRQLGAWTVGQIQKRFGSDKLEPNSPVTIALKGSSAPLIDTGQLRQSIDYQIRQKL